MVLSKFNPGQLAVTPAAISALERAGVDGRTLLARHLNGDWGNLDDHDRKVNDEAMINGGRLLSSYDLPNGETIWVISDPEVAPGVRYATTILLPSDY